MISKKTVLFCTILALGSKNLFAMESDKQKENPELTSQDKEILSAVARAISAAIEKSVKKLQHDERNEKNFREALALAKFMAQKS